MLRRAGARLNRRDRRSVSLVEPAGNWPEKPGQRVEPEWRDRQEREFVLRNDGGKIGDFPDL